MTRSGSLDKSAWDIVQALTALRALVVFLAALVGMWAIGTVAAALAEVGETGQPVEVPYDVMDDGGLFLPSERPGYVVPATTVASDVAIDVSGMVARARVSQTFVNPTDRWMEGVYVFPLPENAAVDRLRLVFDDRVVEGMIMEREAAREAYETARDAGQRASLVSQERPNIFTNAVANIPPGGSITVELEYQQSLAFADGAFQLRFPMVIMPRYIPGTPVSPDAGLDLGSGWSRDTDQVPDASRVTPPVALPGGAPINPVSLTIELDPGFPVADIESPFHNVTVTPLADSRYRVALAAGQTFATRDFELVWRPQPLAVPTLGVFQETVGAWDHYLVMLMAPAAEAGIDRPREVIFIIDRSGSMAGDSIVQAREALHYALDRLGPEDRFNIIAFDDEATQLWDGAREATANAIDRGHRFVDQLTADGGTEMAAALDLALDGNTESDRLRQIVFITDGAVGNEAALFSMIHDRLADSRLFTVGIGSAPNSFFMTEAAEIGRGAFTYIGSTRQVAERMASLFERLEAPALTDVEITFDGAGRAEIYPAIAPDVYVGEPVVVTARLPRGSAGSLLVTGRRDGQAWGETVRLDGATAPGVAALWAGDKITAFERQRYRGADPESVRRSIIQTALAYRLVNEYTSLVAIDDEVVRPPEETIASETVATNAPDGTEMELVLGPVMPDQAFQPAEPLGQPTSLAAIRNMATTGSVTIAQLPATATSAPINWLFGIASLVIATLLLMLAARRRRMRHVISDLGAVR
ncbi:MAG: marine proteobacterial sortase target protein [Azospirillaceae bacterium]